MEISLAENEHHWFHRSLAVIPSPAAAGTSFEHGVGGAAYMAKKRYSYELPDHPIHYGVQVSVSELRVDKEAQRTLNKPRARGIAANLVENALGSIIVSQRANGDLYIVDGMHRHHACEIAGIGTMTAEVHEGLAQEQEAMLFLIKNREASKVNAHDEYRVGLTGRVPLFVDTGSVLTKHGLEMGSSSTNRVGAVQGVLRITEVYGAEVLDRVFTVAAAAWGRTKETWDGMLLGGLGELLGRHGELIDDAELAKKLAKKATAYQWTGLVRTAATGGGTHADGTGSRRMVAYRLMVHEWNKSKRQGNRITLPDAA
ncbi:DUF6551 family protein [Streptomyces iranensis]|uniref:DUF6551 family protein n=1 Tax=Streptomyces iranensis TaxID=576784 RepID=UPI0039B77B55